MKCDSCDISVPYDKAHEVNGFAWCEMCMEKEQIRHQSEDVIDHIEHFLAPPGQLMAVYSRPPKYALPKSQWITFGYVEEPESV